MSEKIKVESGVPLPDGKGPNSKYPWKEMKAGDSFFVESNDLKVTENRLRSAGNGFCSRNAPHLRCVVRAMDGGVRVWMVDKEEK